LLPSECRSVRGWRTRPDPFEEVWTEVEELLDRESGLEAKTIFEELQRRYPGRFPDGQLRTLQRRVKAWRSLSGPGKEVFFAQEHWPGVRGESDFTRMSKLGVTIGGRPFEHLLYHFVLAYSNWETATICFAESFESLSEGLQNALFELGGVPERHRTDRLTAAVRPPGGEEEFGRQYTALLAHYGLVGEKTQAGQPHENGDVEQRHHRLRKALDQALMLRGSREFVDRAAYEQFLREVLARQNAGRQERLAEERAQLRPLPGRRLEACKRFEMRVGSSSTIRVQHNVYSVHNRLIGERVQVRVFAERVEVWYAQRLVESLPRLRGEYGCCIQYRHIIDWLVRKPGAFADYRYRQELFPTSRFRMAYDALGGVCGARADREYLRILHLAARESEQRVDDALRLLLARDEAFGAADVEALVLSQAALPAPTQVAIAAVDLGAYDGLLGCAEVIYGGCDC
jgi:hypothetical protein